MANKRALPDWLKGLAEYVEDSEAPRLYFLWSGIITLAATLQRRVWIPYGLEEIFPNLYVMLVANPGERKAAPISIAKKLLESAEIPVAVDSTSKRALTKELAEIYKVNTYLWEGLPRGMASVAIMSKELSSLLAIDPKGMIEALTDLYDSHEEWKYKTSGEGHDYLYNVCICSFAATTPTWLMNNLPEEAIGGGYTSRNVIVTGGERYKTVPFPKEPSAELFKKLQHDLLIIRSLAGEFKLTPGARSCFESWYRDIPELARKINDVRVAGYLNRMHVIGLKVAMALHVSYDNDLVINENDMSRALELVTSAAYMHSKALGGYGKSEIGPLVDTIALYVRTTKVTTLKELMSTFYRDLSNRSQLEEILRILEAMKRIKIIVDPTKNDYRIEYIKENV